MHSGSLRHRRSCGIQITASFSAAGELTGIDYSDATPDVTLDYDRRGRQTGITDAAGPIVKEAGIALYPQANGFLRIGLSGNRMDLLLSPGSSESPYKLIWLDQDYYADGVHKLEK